MTCIVGVADGETVWMGGDSAGVAGWGVTVRADAKVFTNGPCVFGFTSSFRMGQLLRYRLQVPEQGRSENIDRFMVVSFIDAVRSCMEDGGWKHTQYGREEGGQFLVGYRGRLYQIDSDFQVGIPTDQVAAIGCGEDLALGAMDALADLPPRKRIKRALAIAAARSGGVAAPFLVVKGGAS